MKKCLIFLVTLALGVGVADAQTLVAYYSRTGGTELVAQKIADAIGADLFRIETVDDNWYPDEYRATTDQAKQEIADGTLPPIKPWSNLTRYDIVFVGTPCWWGTIASPVRTFLTDADLSGKTVIPFNTHAGSGTCGHTDIAAMTPKSKHHTGLTVRGTDAADSDTAINMWLREIGVAKTTK